MIAVSRETRLIQWVLPFFILVGCDSRSTAPETQAILETKSIALTALVGDTSLSELRREFSESNHQTDQYSFEEFRIREGFLTDKGSEAKIKQWTGRKLIVARVRFKKSRIMWITLSIDGEDFITTCSDTVEFPKTEFVSLLVPTQSDPP